MTRNKTMDNEPTVNLENQTEAKRIGVLLGKYKEVLGNFDLVSVGKIGYILQSQRQRPMAGNDWVFFDYDDTLVATTEVKIRRSELYRAYLKKLGIQITDDHADKIVEMTDKFSRWEENKGEGEIYHSSTHLAALQWVTRTIKESQDKTDETTVDLQGHLDRIKTQLTHDQESQENDPFYFSSKDKKFTLRGADKMWSKDMEDIFLQTMINPSQYTETIEAAKITGQPHDSIHRMNLGVFTYGDPYYQLLKVFELMKQHSELAISQIWLTRGPKGDFIIETVKTKATSKLEQDYIPEELEEYPGEGLAYGSGYVLGQTEHAVVMMDDSPKELSSILSANNYLKENTKCSFVVVRSKRAGSKEQYREWQVNTPYGEIDFTSHSFLPRDISNILLINRYLNIKSRLGEEDPRVLRLKNELKVRGITVV